MNNYFNIGTKSADLVYGEDKNRIRRALNPFAPNSPGASGNPSGAVAPGGVRTDAPAADWIHAANPGGNMPARQASAADAGMPANAAPGAVPSAAGGKAAPGSFSSPFGASAAAGKAAAGGATVAAGAAGNSTAVSGTGIVLDFSNNNLINSVILSEVLGKPKFFRKGRW